MVSPFLPVLLQVLLDRIIPWNFKDFNLSCRRELLERLKTTLLTLNAVLNDAEEKQITNPFVKEWVDNLQDAVYHADELLEELETLNSQYSEEGKSHVSSSGEWSIADIAKQLIEKFEPARVKMEAELEKTVKRLAKMAEDTYVLGLKESVVGKSSPRLPSTSLIAEATIFGRETDENVIKEYLLSESFSNGESVPIIAIVGIGGIGKTALAQHLYRHSEVENHFPQRAWVYVSEKFDVYQITRTIYESITLRSCNISDLNVIQVKLEQMLKGERLLLVLDDVWNKNYIVWDFMINLLKAAKRGSRIIVTTRNQGVASTMLATVTYYLRKLSDEDCQTVLFSHAFRGKNSVNFPELKNTGMDIAKRCNGLPLAARTLGSLLHSHFDVREWKKILKSKIWDLSPDESNVLPSLRLSYCYLPWHLKNCFAYCSIFPKDHEYKMEELVRLWMAQGFLQQPRNEQSIEDVGSECFHELVSRSFFQFDQNKKGFIMHHLVNELAQFASGEYCCKLEEREGQDISKKARHFSYVRRKVKDIHEYPALSEVTSLRTFLPLSQPFPGSTYPFNMMVLHRYLLKFKYLRVLSLSGYSIDLKGCNFKKLGRLRYLDFSRSSIETLPISICSLYMLQSLLLINCINLKELPEDMCKLINLRCIDVTDTELKMMPPKFGELKKLQMLSTFVVSMDSSGSSISELGDLSELSGKLSIIGLQYLTDDADAESAKLGGKEKITELALKWGDESNDARDAQNQKDDLEKLCPNKNIEKIVLEKYGGARLPDWLGDSSFTKMASLSLKNCYNCESLALLRKLPYLKELQVDGMENLERVGPSNIPFRSLEKLSFLNMSKWATWLPFVIESQDFPSLQELTIFSCKKLRGSLPSRLPSLTYLCIQECLSLQLPANHEMEYPKLQTLHISNSCEALTNLPLDIFSRLEELEILGCKQLESLSTISSDLHWTPEALKDDILKSFPSVKRVSICDCLRFGC